MLYEYLIKNYEKGEPIFSTDINIEGVSKENLRQQFKQLTDKHLIHRYENGIYYIPRFSRLKGGVGLDAQTVVKYKYIVKKKQVIGYFSGNTFANQIGISMQVPLKEEIVSNNTSAIVKEVKIGNRLFLVRKTNIEINEENYKVLQLLDLLKNLDTYIDDNEDEVRVVIQEYVKNVKINKSDIDAYIDYFPLKTYKYLYKMRLEDVFTRNEGTI